MIVDFPDGASQRANDMFHLGERNLIVGHYTHYHAQLLLPIPSKIWLLSNDLQGVPFMCDLYDNGLHYVP